MKIVTLSVEEFSEMLERAATLGAERALQLKPEVDTQGVAQMLGVSSRTVARMEVRGELPPRGLVVDTKIDDGAGVRNEAPLKLHDRGRLWFFPDGSMYVYYTPTHWRYQPK